MNSSSQVVSLFMVFSVLGAFPVLAQMPGATNGPVGYECTENAHCNISCQVDGEKLVQTGSPKTITVTMLARNNYLVELAEQNGQIQIAYLAGAKVVCSLEGLTKVNSK